MLNLAVAIGGQFTTPFQTGGKGIGDIVSLILNASFAVSGLLILLLLIYAGFSIIMGAGRSDPEQAAKGKNAATSALIGFIIVFSAYWIIRIIEIVFGKPFITSPGI